MDKQTKTAIIVFSTIFVVIGVGVLLFRKFDKGLKYPKDAQWAKDNSTLNMVDGLHPKVKQDIANFFTDIEKDGYVAKGTSGLRDSAKQAALHVGNSQNAEAGTSDHEYGFAIDINILKGGKTVLRKASSKQSWIDSGIVDKARKNNLKWGGDFKNYHDPIHFYNDFGIPAQDMKKRLLAGEVDKQGYLKV